METLETGQTGVIDFNMKSVLQRNAQNLGKQHADNPGMGNDQNILTLKSGECLLPGKGCASEKVMQIFALFRGVVER